MLRGVELKGRGEAGGEDGSVTALRKYDALKGILSGMRSVLVAFSGGVDSTFLLKAAALELGDRVVAMTATSPTYPEKEFNSACALAESIGVRHIVVESNELEIPSFADNSPRRCYYCKGELFLIAVDRARSMGIACVADGANTDDLGDYRPGADAAAELGVRSPLQEAALTKDDIRFLSRGLGLSTWDKPALACLSSRCPYGTSITPEGLSKVARGEELLRALGFSQLRARYYGDTVRIEILPADIERLMAPGLRAEVIEGFKGIGFTYVTLDLEGYRTGSMNEVL